MDTFDAIKTRRAVKHYDPDYVMPAEQIDELLGLAMLSPTSFNIQHWRFVAVTDPEVRQQIRAAAWDQAHVTESSLLIVMTADVKAWEKDAGRYWKNAPDHARDMLVPMIGPFYAGKEQLERDEAMRSMGIAAQTIMLAARAMGLDSCPMIGFDHEKVAEIINLPHDHAVGLLITVGKALKPAWPRPGQLSMEHVVVRDRFD
ncbi:MAG: nitroreductase family protein [Planctomycetota bacterium]